MTAAVLFDLDGTFADTAPDLGRAVNAMRSARGLPPVALADTRRVTSLGARGLLGVGFGIAPGDTNYDAMRAEFLDIYENNFTEVMQFVANHTTFDPENELDQAFLQALEPLGIVPGKAQDPKSYAEIDGEVLRTVAEAVVRGQLDIALDPDAASRIAGEMFKPKGEMSLDALLFQSVIGPIGQPAAEVVYSQIQSADGGAMNANRDYVLRMDADDLPPAKAFWSFTLYDTENGFFMPNDRRKYSVGENGGFKLNDEGGIEIHVAETQPEGVPEENWLPLKRGDYDIDLQLRLYAPDLEAYRTWSPPVAQAVN